MDDVYTVSIIYIYIVIIICPAMPLWLSFVGGGYVANGVVVLIIPAHSDDY